MSPATIVFVIAAVAAGCGSGLQSGPDPDGRDDAPGTSSRAADSSVELRFDDTVVHQDLELRWLDVRDSRCPIGVACIWEGQVVATLEAARGEDEPVELHLTLRAGGQPEVVQALGYDWRLLEVEPHPEEGVTPERSDYLARVEIGEA